MAETVTGYGVRRANGELLAVIEYFRFKAVRAAVWHSAAKPGVRASDLLPCDSYQPLNDAERASWRWLYSQGVRIVRVVLREGATDAR